MTDYFQNFDLLFVGIALAANGVLGFTVILSNSKSAVNRAFFTFVISTIPWGILNYLIFQPLPSNIAIWVLRAHVFFAILYCFFLYRLFYIFPQEKISFPKVYYLLVLPAVVLSTLLTLTPFVFERVTQFSESGGIEKVSNGFGVIIFGITVIFLIVYAIYLLCRKLIKATNTTEKSELRLLLTGVTITFVLHILFNLILPTVFGNPRFAPFGSLFVFPFILFTSYAIIRHKLFNIRVIGTAALVFALSVVTFLEITQADSLVVIFYRSSVFLSVLIFGILLIRGVLREVQQREKIAAMAEDVRRAYVTEKRAKENIDRAYLVEKKANEELEKLDKIKNQFVQNTQHDLRTPLTSIMGYSDLLLNGTFGKQNKKTLEVIKKMQAVAQNMIRKVNNFLDVTQFQLGKNPVTLKPGIAISPMLDEIVNELSFKAESKGVVLKLEKMAKDVSITADREKLKAAIFNVIDNSIKYTPKGSVTVKINSNSQLPISNENPKNENSKNAILITIADTGIGMTPESLKTLFDRVFERDQKAKDVASGSGIGLYLATQIIKAHNGKIWAESKGENQGSTFYIELPIG